jgi:hypothetical protein
VADVHGEAARLMETAEQLAGFLRLDLPRTPALLALEVGMLGFGQDVELLATVGTVTVVEVAQLLEDIESPVDGRRGGLGVPFSTPFNDLTAGHVTVGGREDVQDQAPLRRPAQSPRTELVANF